MYRVLLPPSGSEKNAQNLACVQTWIAYGLVPHRQPKSFPAQQFRTASHCFLSLPGVSSTVAGPSSTSVYLVDRQSVSSR